jgi:hypothetical protein
MTDRVANEGCLIPEFTSVWSYMVETPPGRPLGTEVTQGLLARRGPPPCPIQRKELP